MVQGCERHLSARLPTGSENLAASLAMPGCYSDCGVGEVPSDYFVRKLTYTRDVRNALRY